MGDKYHVTIDLQRIQANLLKYEGGRLTELQIRNWLRSVGFTPDHAGSGWTADSDCLSRLDRSEIVAMSRLGPTH